MPSAARSGLILLLIAGVLACGPPASTAAPPATGSPPTPAATRTPAAAAAGAPSPAPPSPTAPAPPVVAAASTAATPRAARFAGGAATIGRDDGPADERPAHVVRLASFEVDVLPVTNADFARFLEAVGPTGQRGEALFDVDDGDARIHRTDGRWRADPGAEGHPVVEASWFGARDYCAWRGARLPTEAEWEHAARGTEDRPYPWGSAPPDPTRARFGAGWSATLPVGSLPAGATPDGLLDMAGNGWEWTSSLYRPYPYRADDGREDPHSREERATRGGGHDSPADHLRATYRGRGLSRGPTAGHHNIGFRCARDLP